MKHVVVYRNIVIDRMKYGNGKNWIGGQFQDVMGREYLDDRFSHHDINPKNQTTLNLHRGGKLTFFKNFISPERAKLLCEDITQ